MPLPIEGAVANLANPEKLLRNSELTKLSSLNPEELRFFEQSWPTIELKRRQQITSRLVKLAEDNFDLNFDNIFRNCLKDQNAEVRSKAIEGLWENEEVSLISPLVNLLEQDTSEKVRSAAATALGKFAMLAELGKLRPCHVSKVSQVLLSTITDKGKPTEVKRRALEAVAPLSLPQVSKAIMESYQSCDSKLKISAIYAMGKNCERRWLPILLGELNNTNAETRYKATGACGELGEEEAVPYLIKLIDDPDVDVQLAAIQALGKIGGSEAKAYLEQCLDSPDEVTNEAAKQALSERAAEKNLFSF